MATEDLLVTLGDLGTVFAYKAHKTIIANPYNPSTTYAVGDYCIYDDALYKCNVAISTPEAWTPGHWSSINVTTELQRLDGSFAYKTNTTVIADNYSTSANYRIDDYCIYNGALYRCIISINAPETFTPAHWAATSVKNELKRLRPITPSSAFSIPSEGNSVSYTMSGLTSDYVLIRWDFQSSPENSPPANLEWITHDGYFTITNNGGTTSETIRPVFVRPTTAMYAAR